MLSSWGSSPGHNPQRTADLDLVQALTTTSLLHPLERPVFCRRCRRGRNRLKDSLYSSDGSMYDIKMSINVRNSSRNDRCSFIRSKVLVHFRDISKSYRCFSDLELLKPWQHLLFFTQFSYQFSVGTAGR